MENNISTNNKNNNVAGAIPSSNNKSSSTSNASSKKNTTAISKKPRAKLIKSAGGVERVAQACERCRAKKTRCDGKRPQCSQCLAVGLECKISDKLSRRAFPRGYTESLEDRVRELEAENRKLIAVIDLKDEQLDMMKKTENPLVNKSVNNNNNNHQTINSIVKKEVIDDSIAGTASVGGAENITDVLVSKLRNNESTSESDTGISPVSLSNIEKLVDGNLSVSNFSNKNALQQQQEFSSASKNQLSSTNLNILNNHNGLHELHQAGCSCGCTSKSLLSHIVHERPTSIAASVLLGTDDERDDDDTSSLLSIENNSKRGANFFDDYASSLGNLRSPSNNNSINNNNTTVTIGDSRRNNVLSLDTNNKNINAYYNNFNVSFEQKEAPGAAAAMALAASSENNNKAHLISSLVAMSTPRTTEEILFIPPLLEKIGRVHGYDSKQAVLTAKTLFSLKMPFVSKSNNSGSSNLNSNGDSKKSCTKKKKGSASCNDNLITIPEVINLKNLNFSKLSKSESHLFFTSMKFPNRVDLDQLITFYFQEWYQIIPIMDKQEFLKNYIRFSKSYENKFNDNGMYGNETFGGIMLLIISLALLGKRKTNKFENNVNDQYNKNDKNDLLLLNYYDSLIKQVIVSSIVDSSTIQSLQVLTLALEYMLNIGDIGTSYILRGKVVSMAQQLRLHRCPSAVLGSSGLLVSKTQQSERRILFWCVYVLDTFSSLQLGVPRLIKDYEIECALPFANDDETDDNNTNILIINNSQLSLVGKVSNMSLAVMRYSKILGNILDSLFRRGGALNVQSLDKSCLILENLLNDWRKDLPPNLIFKLDVNGLLKNHDYSSYHHRTLALIILYYQAKILIYLPMMAIYSSRGSMSYINIQQSCGAILSITNFLAHNHNFLSLPNNCARMRSRYGLLAAKGALDYARSGNLFWNLKNRLFSLVEDLKIETKMEINGCLSNNCIRIYEETIKAILEPPSKNANNNYEEPLINNVITTSDSGSRGSATIHSYAKTKNCSIFSSKRKQQEHEYDSDSAKTKKEANLPQDTEDLRSTAATSFSSMNNPNNMLNNKNITRSAIILKADTNLISNTNSIVSPSSSCSPDISTANLPTVIHNNNNNSNQILFSNSQNSLTTNLKFPSFSNLLNEHHDPLLNSLNKNDDSGTNKSWNDYNRSRDFTTTNGKNTANDAFPQKMFQNNPNDMFSSFNDNSNSSNEPLNMVLQTMSNTNTTNNSDSNISFSTRAISSMSDNNNHNNNESTNSLSSAPVAKSISPKEQMFDIDNSQMFSDFAADGSLALAPILLGDSNSNDSSMTYNNGNINNGNGAYNTDQFNSFINGLDFDQLHEKTFSNGYDFRGVNNKSNNTNNVIVNAVHGSRGLIDGNNSIAMSRNDDDSGYNHREAMMLLMKGANTCNSSQQPNTNSHLSPLQSTNDNGFINLANAAGMDNYSIHSHSDKNQSYILQDNSVPSDSFSKFENSFLTWPRN